MPDDFTSPPTDTAIKAPEPRKIDLPEDFFSTTVTLAEHPDHANLIAIIAVSSERHMVGLFDNAGALDLLVKLRKLMRKKGWLRI